MALILTPLATDNFVPDADPLNPANWTTWTDGSTQPLRAVSGVAIQRDADVGVNYSGDYYSGIVVPNDMYITATLANWVPANGPEADFYFRSDPTDTVSFYDVYLSGNGDSTSTIILTDQNGGSYYEDDTAAISAGDVFTVAVVGQNLYLYQNGVLLTNPSTIGTGPTSGVAGLFALAFVAASDVGWSNFIIGSAALSSGAYSQPDCRVTKPNSATGETVNGTILYDSQTSSNPAIPPTDSRVSKPVACGAYPQNSRTPGTYGPGE